MGTRHLRSAGFSPDLDTVTELDFGYTPVADAQSVLGAELYIMDAFLAEASE